MKEIKAITPYESEQFDITVNRYLTYAQIQQIINAVVKMDNNWAERQQNIDMLVLDHATNIGAEKLQQIGHDTLLQSGLIDEVRDHICNLTDLYEAINWTTSIQRSLLQLSQRFDQNVKMLEKKAGAK